MKKSKKSSSKKPKKKPFASLLFVLFRVGILILFIGSGIVLYKPEIVQNEDSREKVLGIRQNLITIASAAGNKSLAVFQPIQSIANRINSASNSAHILEQEINVDQAVLGISTQIEKLPVERYQRFKANFCADAVATASAEFE